MQKEGVLLLRLWNGFREVLAVEFAEISQQVLVDDFVTDDRTRVQMVKFELGSVLIKGTF